MYKKSVTLIIILSLMMSMFSIGFSEEELLVSKVVFKGLDSLGADEYVGMGGIRFYHNNAMIPSGAVVTPGSLVGETEAFKVTVSSNHNASANGSYAMPSLIDTSKPQTGTYIDDSYWIGLRPHDDQSIVIDFKTAQPVDKIEFVPIPQYANHAIANDFVIEVHYTNGKVASYDVTPTTALNTVQTLVLTEPNDLTLSIDSTTDHVDVGSTIDVYVKLSGATDIYAEDFTVKYDPNAFELMNTTITNSTAYKVMHENSTSGFSRYIVASTGPSYGINSDTQLIKMQFKAKDLPGDSEITFTSGLVANSKGDELTPRLIGKTITISRVVDVNNTNTFTLGDLAIASSLVTKPSSEWDTFKPDVNLSGIVDIDDLSLIVNKILN